MSKGFYFDNRKWWGKRREQQVIGIAAAGYLWSWKKYTPADIGNPPLAQHMDAGYIPDGYVYPLHDGQFYVLGTAQSNDQMAALYREIYCILCLGLNVKRAFHSKPQFYWCRSVAVAWSGVLFA